jgi:hypothetical protein
VDLSGTKRKVAKWLTWLVDGSDEGDLVVGLDGSEPYRRPFPLEADDAAGKAAVTAFALGLRVALPIYLYLPDTEPRIVRSHVAGCRFLDLDGDDLAQLDHRPDKAVGLGHFTYGFWAIEPIDGDDLTAFQIELRDTLGGDPSWSGSPHELYPIPSVLYGDIGSEPIEAVELKVRP